MTPAYDPEGPPLQTGLHKAAPLPRGAAET
jgi:hypothetical protein